uniref:Chromosome 4 open reading frame 19 n=1 Tax=Coturnix japonica TaxID=93934 RepID=A0A8C2U6J0_COTJA
MGCRCCKMIQSYIFDPEELQSPGCTHEGNSYKQEEQRSNKFKIKKNCEIKEQKKEPQKDELKGTGTKNQVNSTGETLWNHRDDAFQDDSLVKCVAKLDVAVNGSSSHAGVHPILSPSTNSVKEASEQSTSSQPLDLGAGSHRKADCSQTNSIQGVKPWSIEDSNFLKGSAVLDTQNNDAIKLPDIDYCQNGNQIRNYVEKDSISVNYAHPDQMTKHSAMQGQDLHVTPSLHAKESSIEPFNTDSTSVEKLRRNAPTASQAPTHQSHTDISGETEEEDAEVAAALAALEAATAGEDLEEDDVY